MVKIDALKDFYKSKTVLITGHTGFKGSWLCQILLNLGAKVVGYSLEPPTEPNLFNILNLGNKMSSVIGDIRDYSNLLKIFNTYNPEIVFHLAAQPIVKDSYLEPLYTYETNVLGTANVCECIRNTNCVKSFLNVTTDKVYLNNDLNNHPFKEDEPLDGYDPYSNSKSCSELVTHSYFKSFLKEKGIAVSTARAGNVIGGGDFADFRLIPDCYRAIHKGVALELRNPYSTRPYQHVLEPLYCYLSLAMMQYKNKEISSSYNIGPDYDSIINNFEVVTLFKEMEPSLVLKLQDCSDDKQHEAKFLSLDNNKIKEVIGYKPIFSIKEAVQLSCDWYVKYLNKKDMVAETDKQIELFFNKV